MNVNDASSKCEKKRNEKKPNRKTGMTCSKKAEREREANKRYDK